jgi:Protein of unknown function (DUF3306)
MLSRWSRLKTAAKNPTPTPSVVPPSELAAQAALDANGVAAQTEIQSSEQPVIELPNIADLTAESDFRPFMQTGVDAADRNAALKKLFTDPHYNQMDGLDIYIDDYSKPDPIPVEMLKRLMASKFLGLYEEPLPVEPEPLNTPENEIVGDSLETGATLGAVETTRENPSSTHLVGSEPLNTPKERDFLDK